jgi:hypothetical protein
MYPTVNALMELWSFHIAERIDAVETTAETRSLLNRVNVDACLERELWPRLATFVLVEPEGDILPVRARYEEARDSWQIGVNPLWGEPRWYALADAIAAKLLTGKAARILRAVELRPRGRAQCLRPLRLRGEVEIDPYRDDPFKLVIEQRSRTPKDDPLNRFLKIFANGTAYGILAEMNPQEDVTSWVQVFTGTGAFGTKVRTPERPGEFAFPPLASFIAGGARLMLAILEALVAELGGSYAMCDTDSMSIVATRERQLLTSGLTSLSWAEVDRIRGRFASLNPYESQAVGSILKVEDVNFLPSGDRDQLWCYAVSAKRYVHFHRTR